MLKAYYNEIDEYAAQWLRNLITAGHIAPGDVDTRSILDVRASELVGYTQCHFFAGIGVWSYALRRAGWPDSRRAWTGSCPCQPFSAAGKGNGFADERHLWPAWHHLIGQSDVDVIFGEQVASKDADTWIDLVQTDMEALGYAFGAVPFPSASVGAPHIRDRAYWVADSELQQRPDWKPGIRTKYVSGGRIESAAALAGFCGADRMDDTNNTRPQGHPWNGGATGWQGSSGSVAASGIYGGVAYTKSAGSPHRRSGEALPISSEACGSFGAPATGPTNGFWRDADWLYCRDGKWRPVEPGTFPLANGAPARVGRLRAYGNAINAEAAITFIQSYMECRP